MSRHEETVYRTTKKVGEPSIAEMKSQASRLKQDLDQFKGRGAGAALIQPLQERIRDLEAAIAHAQVAKGGASPDPDAPDYQRPVARTTSNRFPPRGKPTRV
ncbi:Gas vesicle protein V [Azospirillum doebereinerae]